MKALVVIALLTASAYFATGPGGFTSCFSYMTRPSIFAGGGRDLDQARALSECSGYLVLPAGFLVGAIWVAWKGISIRS